MKRPDLTKQTPHQIDQTDHRPNDYISTRLKQVNLVNYVPRVMRIIARLNIGGPAIHTVLLTRYMEDLGYETLLVTGRVGQAEGDMGYLADAHGVKPFILTRVGRRINVWDDLLSFVRILSLIKSFRPHIIHTHTAKAGALGRLAALVYNMIQGLRLGFQKAIPKIVHRSGEAKLQSFDRPGKCRVVHTFHGHVLRGYFSPLKSRVFLWIERVLARFTDTIAVVGEKQKQELCKVLGIGMLSQYRVIPLGFDLTGLLHSKERKGELKRDLGLSPEVRVVGIIGRLTPIKDHFLFLEAAGLLSDLRGQEEIRFLVVGDGELRGDLEEFTGRMELVDRVIFAGWKQDLKPVYADLDVLALSSRNEGTPVAVIEAMAAGVPVVATDVGGVGELIADSEGGVQESKSGGFAVRERGILVNPGDAEGLAKGLDYVLEHPEVTLSMVEKGREYVTRRHSKERLLKDMDSLYRSLLKQ